MTELDFQSLAKQGYTRVPVIAEARADLYTPLAVYLKLAGGPHSYLLESVVGGERFGRYSFIGLPCAERIEARGASVRRLLRDARGADVCLAGDDVDVLRLQHAADAGHGLLQQARLTGECQQLLRCAASRQWPEARAGAAGHHNREHQRPVSGAAPAAPVSVSSLAPSSCVRR